MKFVEKYKIFDLLLSQGIKVPQDCRLLSQAVFALAKRRKQTKHKKNSSQLLV